MRLEAMEAPKAQERMLAGVRPTLGSPEPRVSEKPELNTTEHVVGDALGMSRSGSGNLPPGARMRALCATLSHAGAASVCNGWLRPPRSG